MNAASCELAMKSLLMTDDITWWKKEMNIASREFAIFAKGCAMQISFCIAHLHKPKQISSPPKLTIVEWKRKWMWAVKSASQKHATCCCVRLRQTNQHFSRLLFLLPHTHTPTHTHPHTHTHTHTHMHPKSLFHIKHEIFSIYKVVLAHRVPKTYRMPNLYKCFSAKKPNY